MRRLRLIVTACLIPAAAPAQGLPLEVGEMQRACRIVSGGESGFTPESAIAAGACFGAMRGVVQVMQANCRSIAGGSRPAGALSVGEIPASEDAIAAFDAWAEAHPDQADAPAEYGIIVALSEAFPCVPSGSGGPPVPSEPGRSE